MDSKQMAELTAILVMARTRAAIMAEMSKAANALRVRIENQEQENKDLADRIERFIKENHGKSRE